jgi:hypothetical protein
MYYDAIGGFQFHDKKTVGSYTYYIFVDKDGRILIKKINDSTLETRFGLSNGISPTYVELLDNPSVLSYNLISELNL